MQLHDVGPCGQVSETLHIIIAVGVAANTALGTWLAHRRYRQDRYYRSSERRAFELWRKYVKTPDDLFDEGDGPPGKDS